MSDVDDLSKPMTELPKGFTPPPGMPGAPGAPALTPADFAAANAPHGAGIGQSPDGVSWMTIALGLGGVAIVGAVAYAVYRSHQATSAILQPFPGASAPVP